MAKSDATKVVLEIQTLKDELKNIKEVKIGWKGYLFGTWKRMVNIVLEEDDDLNPNLSKKELKEREKRDKELDALNALKAKNEVEEVEENNVKELLTMMKVMFLE